MDVQDARMNGTQQNSQPCITKSTEELLTGISNKLNSLISKLDEIFTNTNRNASIAHEETAVTTETNNKVVRTNSLETTSLEVQQGTLKPHFWKKMLKQRKHTYWKNIRCSNIANIYQNWRNKEKPILPRKFLIKEIRNEPPEETAIRANLALCRLETEIALLQSRKLRHEEKIETIDTVMFAEITEQCQDQYHDELKKLWKEDTKREEEKSIKMWQKHQQWFEDYEKNYGDKSIMKMKPQQRSRRKSKTNADTKLRGTELKHQTRNYSRTYAEITSNPPQLRTGVPYPARHNTANSKNMEYRRQPSIYKYQDHRWKNGKEKKHEKQVTYRQPPTYNNIYPRWMNGWEENQPKHRQHNYPNRNNDHRKRNNLRFMTKNPIDLGWRKKHDRQEEKTYNQRNSYKRHEPFSLLYGNQDAGIRRRRHGNTIPFLGRKYQNHAPDPIIHKMWTNTQNI